MERDPASLRRHIEDLREEELASVRSEVSQGRREHILKSLDERGRGQELVRQQYTGRYPFELLQNASDASGEAGRKGRVRFVLTDTALLVADNGIGFGEKQVDAICTLGRSSKDPGKSIGYKGLGFKSVGEICVRPQVVSQGVQFGFDHQRARNAIEDLTGPLQVTQRLPGYAMPFILEDHELQTDLAEVQGLLRNGYTTVLRLPFREGVTRETVERQVRETLSPRLLLFLSDIAELQLTGVNDGFSAIVERRGDRDEAEVTLRIDDSRTERWIVFGKQEEVTNRSLVRPLGDAWAGVTAVTIGAAVPLDTDGLPLGKPSPQPVHVYFPTEQASGFGIIFHADFALELDRKRIGRSPETSEYNQWLSERLAAFVGCSVAPRLAEIFEGDGRVVEVLTSRLPPDSAWEPKFDLIVDALRRSRFIPTLDGSLRVAVEARLLPESIPDSEEAALFLDLPKRTVLPSIQADRLVRSFLRNRLSMSFLSVRETVETLSERRRDDAEGFYNFLVRWRDRHGRLNLDLVQALRELPCIRLQSGEWVSAAQQPYFPRERGQLEIPENIEVGIVGIPDIEASEELDRLMEDLDVRPFQWAFVLPDYVLPKLTNPDVDSHARAGAFKVLSQYFKSTSAGDKGLREKIGQVLLPVRDVHGKIRRLERANKCYFPAEWTTSTLLEDIYGPLQEAEFLDVAPPPPGDGFHERFSFFRALGVQDRPRLLTASASSKDAYPIKNGAMPPRHPHHTFKKHWTSWALLSEVKAQMLCDAGHAASQRLKTSFVLDRLDRILEDGSEKQRTALWKALARHWGDTYVGALESTVRCWHGNHTGERERPIPSLLAHMLRDLAWIPMQSTSETGVAAGRDIWRTGPDTPQHIRKMVPILSEALNTPESAELARDLGVVDATRLRPPELVELLNTLAERHATDDDKSTALFDAARWAMGRLNEALRDEELPEQVRPMLLARQGDRLVFVQDPVVAVDRQLEESWSELLPVYAGDRDSTRLPERLKLRSLEALVTVTAVPIQPLAEARARIRAHFDERKAYLAAAVLHSARTRRAAILRGLGCLELNACETLVLKYEYEGETRERDSARCFIAERTVGDSPGAANLATAWLELGTDSAQPDWFAFASKLARYLKVPNQADAFTLILSTDFDVVYNYMASRGIEDGTVEELRVELDSRAERLSNVELVPAFKDAKARSESSDMDESETEGGHIEMQSEELIRENAEDQTRSIAESQPEEMVLPDFELDQVEMLDLTPQTISTSEPQPPSFKPEAGAKGNGNGVDFEAQHKTRKRHGDRAEELVYKFERRRLEEAGLHADAVEWISWENSTSPFDILSISTDAQQIYIEVKATASSDPWHPIDISEAELNLALQKGEHYFIYRVTSVHTATPRIYRIRNIGEHLRHQRAHLTMSKAKLRLGRDAAEDSETLFLSSIPPAAE